MVCDDKLIRYFFQNLGLICYQGYEIGRFGHYDRTRLSSTLLIRKLEVIIDQKNASDLTSDDMHTTPPPATGLL